MAQRANITSIDAIQRFRSHLVTYVDKAKAAVSEIGDEVNRTRQWLHSEQRMRWEFEIKRRQKKLEQAQSELLSAKMANLREATDAEARAFKNAQKELQSAENKLRVVKRWARDYDGQVQPIAKQAEKLGSILGNDMPKAIAHLAQVLDALDAYSKTRPEDLSIPVAAPKSDDSAEGDETGEPKEES